MLSKADIEYKMAKTSMCDAPIGVYDAAATADAVQAIDVETGWPA